MEDGGFVREILGKHIFEHFIRIKRGEWEKYRQQVTKWEVSTYLESV